MAGRTPVVIAIVAALLVAFVALNALLGAAVRGVRLDLTAGRVYSLSPGVGPLLRELPEPVRLELYYTADAGRSVPAVHAYAQRVREFLEEMALASGGRVELRVVDPQPFSEEEDAAVAAGLASLSIDGAGRALTLGLVAVDAVDRREAIPFLDPTREPFLEYEVVRLVQSVGRRTRPRVGLLTTLPMEGGFDPRMPERPRPAWQVLEQMRGLFEVVPVAPSSEALPEKLDALVIAHPKGFSEALLRSIDEYALEGGRLLVFLDPVCESEAAPPGMQAMGMDRGSDLGPLPEAWGIDWTRDRVVGDLGAALQVQMAGPGGQPQVVAYLPWLAVTGDQLAADDPLTGRLERVHLATAAALSPREEVAATIVPLLSSTRESMLIDAMRVSIMPDPQGLLAEFVSDDTARWLGVRIDGEIRSAFPADPPPGEGVEGEAAAAPSAAPARTGRASIVVIGDADLLADDNWIVEERVGPISLGWRPIADNGDLVLNAVELLVGDPALVALRGRAGAQRPFERVEEIRRSAEQQYRARERQLQEQLRAAEDRITELQREKSPENRLILTPEQEQALDDAEAEVLAARRELRQVQFDLQASYEALGTRLALANIVAWPLMVALAALAWALHRGRVTRGGAA